ncbi:MAG: acetolactate synthase large subunit, partial [Acidobacteria bacterium]
AIGTQFARPNELVWVVAGDGGFQMTMPELSTVAANKLPIKIAIINNGYLGMVRQWQEFFHGRRYTATPIGGPDFCLLAAAHGIPSLRVAGRGELTSGIRQARRAEGPVVVEFRVEPEDAVYPMVPAGRTLGEMIRRPHPGPRRLSRAGRGD